MSKYLIEIIVLAVLTLIFGLVINSWIKSYKAKQDEADVNKLSHDQTLTSNGLAVVVKSVPKKDADAVHNALKNFDPKPIAEMIYNAEGVFNDDEEQVYTAFAMLQSKAELALLSTYFEMLYKKPLITYIQSFLNTSELAKVQNVIKNLKAY